MESWVVTGKGTLHNSSAVCDTSLLIIFLGGVLRAKLRGRACLVIHKILHYDNFLQKTMGISIEQKNMGTPILGEGFNGGKLNNFFCFLKRILRGKSVENVVVMNTIYLHYFNFCITI